MPVLIALIVTLVVEVPLVALVFLRHDAARMALVAAVATAATNLTMNAVLFGRVPYVTYLGVGEVGATLLEAAAYYALSRERDLGRSLLASAVANAASFGAGWLLWG